MFDFILIVKFIWYMIVGKLKFVYHKEALRRGKYCVYMCPNYHCLSRKLLRFEYVKCPYNCWNLNKF
jgi:hypothetical protein